VADYVEHIDSRRKYVMGSKILYNSDHNEKQTKRSKLRPVKVISLVNGVDRPFQQYFSHIVAVSFTG
jgi:hypothetical protein